MNKILSVNIGGMIFQLDEEAFEMLKGYIDSIRRHFSRTEGSHEITSDIEARIAEMLQTKLHAGKQAINQADVESIIAAMGRPEEFGDAVHAEDETSTHYTSATAQAGEPTFKTTRKRLFRDPEKGVIGGVCAGIAAYFGTDIIWIRLIFILLVFVAFGTGLLIYIILWIIMPKAKTITDKLEMRGENITISNIEKSVRDEFGNIKKNFNSFQSSASGQEMRTRVNDFGNMLAQLIKYAAKFIVKFAGVLLIIFGIVLLASLILTYVGIFPAFSEFHFTFFPEKWQQIVANTSVLFLVGLPLLLLIILGFRVVFNIRYQNRAVAYSFLSIWIISLLTALVSGGFFIKNYNTESVRKEKIKLGPMLSDTVTLSSIESGDTNSREISYKFGMGGKVAYSGSEYLSKDVRLDIEKSETTEMELVKVIRARGKSYTDNDSISQVVNYNFVQENNKLLFNQSYTMNVFQPWRHHEVKLILRVPEGKVLRLDENLRYFLDDVANVTNTWDQDMVGHSWLMTKKGLECLDCNFKEMEKLRHRHYHHENNQDEDVDIRIDGKDGEIKIQENSKDGKKKVRIRVS